MNIFSKLGILMFVVFLSSCSGLGTEEDNRKSRLMSGSVDEIIARSGTTFRNTDRAMKDAYNRLNTGGGMLGKKPMSVGTLFNGENENVSASIGLPINAILWKSSIETINFMPLSSADPFAGVIITDWYSSPTKSNERCKVNIFIKGKQLKSTNLDVNTFCQNLKENLWVNKVVNEENNIKLENAILNKAKKLKLSIN
jgi:hypothetical protein